MKGGIASVFAILAIISLVVQPRWAVTCGQVDAALVPCISYPTEHIDSLFTACCGRVKAVKTMAKTTVDKRACCSCVKAAVNCFADLKDDTAQSLPIKCGIQMDVPISRSVDCDK